MVNETHAAAHPLFQFGVQACARCGVILQDVREQRAPSGSGTHWFTTGDPVVEGAGSMSVDRAATPNCGEGGPRG